MASSLNTFFGLILLGFLSLTHLKTWQIILISNLCCVFFNYHSFGKIVFNESSKKKFSNFSLFFIIFSVIQVKITSEISPFFDKRIYALITAALITSIPNYLLLKKNVYKN